MVPLGGRQITNEEVELIWTLVPKVKNNVLKGKVE